MRNRTKRTFWTVLMVLFAAAACVCFGIAAWYFFGLKRAASEGEKVAQEVMQQETEKPSEAPKEKNLLGEASLEEIETAEFTGEIDAQTPAVPEDALADGEADEEDIPVNFVRLESYNPELYAWIRIPGTNIDYPVAQHEGEDQLFYLHHDLYGEPQYAGCIFSRSQAAKDFTDAVTVLYGHNMRNGSMFQNLHLFREKDYFDEHRELYIYTADQAIRYEICAVYPFDDRDIEASYDFSDPEDLKQYRESIMHPHSMEANVLEGLEITENDKILTLSTCIYGATDQRLLLQAVRR